MKRQFEAATSARRICVVGASGGIGRSLVEHLAGNDRVSEVVALSRAPVTFDHANVTTGHIDLLDEASIASAANAITGPLDQIVVATGLLHGSDRLRPEKALGQLNATNLMRVLAVNTVGPALVARYFAALMPRESRSVFAALSARVGSIGDNQLGGWYSYRASKAALNMILRTMAIEMRRTHPDAIVAGLHPGTVDTSLSKPFQRNVPAGKLFDVKRAAAQLIDVLDGLTIQDSGQVFDWAGKRVPE